VDDALPPRALRALVALWRELPVAPKDKASCSERSYYCDADGWLGGLVRAAAVRALEAVDARTAQVAAAGAAVVGRGDGDGDGGGDASAEGSPLVLVAPLVRFLHYPDAGGRLLPHVDLSRRIALPRGVAAATATAEDKVIEQSPRPIATATAEGGGRAAGGGARAAASSTHSFLLYLYDCASGGETVLHDARAGDAPLARHGGVAHGPRRALHRVAPRAGRLLLMPHACPHSGAEVIDAPKLLIRGEVLVAARK